MSPELFDPEKYNLRDSRQTKHSDRYALGMVIYEVLSGQVPFFRNHGYGIIGRIIKGERPGRPQGEEGVWFTDNIWGVLLEAQPKQPAKHQRCTAVSGGSPRVVPRLEVSTWGYLYVFIQFLSADQ